MALAADPAGEDKNRADDTRYPVFLAIDQNPETAWVANNQTAFFELFPCRLKKISMIPGYTKSEKTYLQNRRPASIRYRLWHFPAGGGMLQPSSDWIPADVTSSAVFPVPGKRFSEIPVMAEHACVAGIEIQVVKSLPEKTRYEDICISEIQFWGIPQGYRSGDAIAAQQDGWTWAQSAFPQIDMEGERLGYDFDWIDGGFAQFTHSWTGGAVSTFKGTSSAVKGGYRLKGSVVTTQDGVIEEEKVFDRVVTVSRINPFMVLVDGHLFIRGQKLERAKGR